MIIYFVKTGTSVAKEGATVDRSVIRNKGKSMTRDQIATSDPLTVSHMYQRNGGRI